MTLWFLVSGRVLPAGVICLACTLCFGCNQKKLLTQDAHTNHQAPVSDSESSFVSWQRSEEDVYVYV